MDIRTFWGVHSTTGIGRATRVLPDHQYCERIKQFLAHFRTVRFGRLVTLIQPCRNVLVYIRIDLKFHGMNQQTSPPHNTLLMLARCPPQSKKVF